MCVHGVLSQRNHLESGESDGVVDERSSIEVLLASIKQIQSKMELHSDW